MVSRQRKLALMARASTAAWSTPGDGRAQLEPLPSIQFLVGASASAAPPPRAARRNLDDRIGWMIELFERQAAARLSR